MGKPKRIDRPVDKTISLSQELVTRINLELFSDMEQKVPFGAWSKLITVLLANWLAECRQPNQSKELSND